MDYVSCSVAGTEERLASLGRSEQPDQDDGEKKEITSIMYSWTNDLRKDLLFILFIRQLFLLLCIIEF